MKKIVCLILLICVVLSLYSNVFLESRSVNFQEAYTSTLSFITNIGSVFEPLKDIHELTLKCLYVSLNLPDIMGLLFTNLGDRISGFFTSLGDRISGFFTSLGDRISGLFTNLIVRMSEFFTNLGDRIAGFFEELINGIAGFFRNLTNSFTSALRGIWENILSGFGLSKDKDYIQVGPCPKCGAEPNECFCYVGDVIPPGTVV